MAEDQCELQDVICISKVSMRAYQSATLLITDKQTRSSRRKEEMSGRIVVMQLMQSEMGVGEV